MGHVSMSADSSTKYTTEPDTGWALSSLHQIIQLSLTFPRSLRYVYGPLALLILIQTRHF